MLNYTHKLYDNENTPAADDGSWTGQWMNVQCRRERTHSGVQVEIIGTATVVLEGCNDTSLGAQLIQQFTTSDSIVAEMFTYLRGRVTSATVGAKVRITVDGVVKYLTADRFSSTGIG